MQNIYDKLLNVKFEKSQSSSSNDSLNIEEINAQKSELIQGKKTNNTINNQIDSLNKYNKIANDKFEHNYKKLEKGRNTATVLKKASLFVMGVCAVVAAVGLLYVGIPFIFSTLTFWPAFFSCLALAALTSYGVYQCASYYKEDAEKKQLMGLMQHGEALRKHTISAQAGLITSTYTHSKDIPSIQQEVHLVTDPVGLEADDRFYKGKDKEDNNDYVEKVEDNSNKGNTFYFYSPDTQRGRQ